MSRVPPEIEELRLAQVAWARVDRLPFNWRESEAQHPLLQRLLVATEAVRRLHAVTGQAQQAKQ